MQVNATEGDGGSVTYSLVAGDASRFEVDSVTGLITTLQPLDREDQNRYILTVQASDMPGPSALSSFAQVWCDLVGCVSAFTVDRDVLVGRLRSPSLMSTTTPLSLVKSSTSSPSRSTLPSARHCPL